MSTAKPKKVLYKNPDGEIFDPEAAIKRHPALANLDVTLETSASGDLEFTTIASGATMARLCQILNSAPVNGDPLHAIVPLRLYSNATECDIEDIEYFLHDNGLDPTLENIAIGYLSEAETTAILELDVPLGTETQKFAVVRIASRHDSARERLSHLGKCLSHIDFKIPGEPGDAEPNRINVVSEQRQIRIEDLEGHVLGGWRILHALKPVKGAPHGGFILERLEGGHQE